MLVAERKPVASPTLPQSRVSYGGAVRLVIAGFSIIYFTDVLLRASQKLFWYDELLTLYFGRFPSFAWLLGALRTGIDSNPPGFDLVTAFVARTLGVGLLELRLPEILAFWIGCICLFQFVNRRAGLPAGFIAMVFPMLTGAYFYAYEARPHALLFGLGGVALLCWDEAHSSGSRRSWIVLGFVLFAALMLHPYALLLIVPFAAAEAFRAVRTKQMDWIIWAALILPAAPAILLFVPLLKWFHNAAEGTSFVESFRPGWFQISNFYSFLFSTNGWVLLLGLLLVAASHVVPIRDKSPVSIGRKTPTQDDLVVAITFAVLPLLGILVARTTESPFFARYFLSSLIGISVLAGLSVTFGRGRGWLSLALCALLSIPLLLGCSRTIWHKYRGWNERIIEPSSAIPVDTVPGNPLASRSLLNSAIASGVPIAILDAVDFLYLTNYASETTRKIVYVTPSSNDFFNRALTRFLPFSPVKYQRPMTYAEFAASHPHFFAYANSGNMQALAALSKVATVASVNLAEDHLLADVSTKAAGK